MKPPPVRCGIRPSCLALLGALAAACASQPPGSSGSGPSSAPTPAPPAAAAAELRVGSPVEHEISAGETQSYLVTVEAAEYLRIVAKPRAIDVALRLLAPDGTPLAEADGPGGSKRTELLSLVTVAGGRARLEVTRRDEGERRGYRLELEEQRPARGDDALRVEAERAFSEAVHRRSLSSGQEMRAALQILERALPLWQQIGDRHGESDTLTQIGLSHWYLGDLQAASARLAQALALAETSDYPTGVAEALNGQGLVSRRQGQTEVALQCYQRALMVARGLHDDELTAKSLHNLGVVLLERGDVEQALEHFQEALALRQRIGDLLAEGTTLSSMGETYLWYQGELDTAERTFRRALDLARAAADRRMEANILLGLAATAHRRGELQEALVGYQQALEKLREAGDPFHLARAQEFLGNLYQQLRDLERALHHYQDALASYHSQGARNYEAGVLASIGLVEHFLGNVSAAKESYQQALAISSVKNSRTEGLLRHQIGTLLRDEGDLPGAIESLDKALALHRLTHDRSDEAHTLVELGTCHSLRKENSAAEENFLQALALARQVENPAIESMCLLSWATHARDSGDLDSARAKIEEALKIIEATRHQVLSQDLRATYFASRRAYFEFYVDVLMRLAELRPGQGYESLAFQASERAHARGLVELLAEGKIDVKKGVSPELRAMETRLDKRTEAAQSRLAALLARPDRNEATIAAARGELATLAEERQRVEWEIRSRHPRYAEVRYPSPPRLSEVQELLDDRTALVEYSVGAKASFVFVATRASLASHRLPPGGEIEQLVRTLRESIKTPERRYLGSYVLASRRLFQMLIAPVAGSLRHTAHLVIVPDGALHLLSFEALLTKDLPAGFTSARELPYLLLDHSVVYVPSAGALKTLRAAPEEAPPRSAHALRFMGFADPALRPAAPVRTAPAALRAASSSQETWRAAPLPESRREVREIAGLYRPDEALIFLGSDATEENVKSNDRLRTAQRLHFATHGVVDEAQPELSGLVLAEDEDPAEDGVLHTYEVFNLDLSAELVVLSACDTGLGRLVTGEGLVGLTRAFLYAGASNVLVSLWPVADAAGPQLMVNFYRELDEGSDAAVALRKSKLKMLEDARWAHPFYWAPFILVGEARSRDAAHS